jgi:pimeloyl-ACP methyl ester carboxylesterase
MNRALPCLLLSVCLLLIGVQRVSAATWDAGSLEGVRDTVEITKSTAGSVHWLKWALEETTSTYTGLVKSFSIVVKGEYTGSSVAMTGTLLDVNSGISGAGYVNFGDVCDVSENISVTSTDCVVTFNLDVPVMVTSSNPVKMAINTYNQSGGAQTTYYASAKPRSASWNASWMHPLGMSQGIWYSWDDMGGSYTNNQLAWAWNYCPENCNSNILFLPGSQGSRLYNNSEMLWEPGNEGDVEDLFLDSTGTSIRTDIYTKDLIDELPLTGDNVYYGFLEALENWKLNGFYAQYATSAYDWRLSLDDILEYGHRVGNGKVYYSGSQRSTSTPYIIEQLRTLAQTSRTGKVTIVAHSYGGLVAKALMMKLETEDPELLSKIDNLVLVGVPQTGTPHAIAAGLHGYHLGIPKEFPILISPQKGREFASSSPMFYNLLPSENYFTNSGAGSHVPTSTVSFIAGSGTQMYVNAYGTTITGTSELYNYLVGDEGRSQAPYHDLEEPVKLSPSLIADAEMVHFELDTWTPPTSTHVYQIAGWGLETVGYIKYEPVTVEGFDFMMNTPELVVDGDGTVVVPSALAMSTSTSNIKRYWLNLRDYAVATSTGSAHSHEDIFEVLQLRNFILDIVTNSITTPPEFITVDQPAPDPGDKRLHFFLHSPLALAAYDASGNEISATASTIRGAIFRQFGEIQFVSVPAEVAPELRLTGYASGRFTLEVREVLGNEVIASTKFVAVPTTTSTRATMFFSDGTIEHAAPLKVDVNGDSSVDFNLIPKINQSVYVDPTEEAVKYDIKQ